jgi:SAM-dependent methyltransferase
VIDYYSQHAREFIRRTDDLDMAHLYGPFLQLVPHGGSILDAGCGSGRDAREFCRMGYVLTAIDASQEMVDACRAQIGDGAVVEKLRFQDLQLVEAFDGIWACASLLHVPTDEMFDVIHRLTSSLRHGGVMYMSFKVGGGERWDGNRLFNDYDEARTRELLSHEHELSALKIWRTADVRPGRHADEWLNALVARRVAD